ncbi:MAG: hypothetical protein HUJ80_02875 [Firmicutes bacterium]|nr:hypothetical protein [Bacillota bacterium]
MNKALFKEDIKRFWPLSAAAFLLYFLFGPFDLLSGNGSTSYQILSMLSNNNAGFLVLECMFPVVICTAVFQYQFKGNSNGVIHAMPFTKKELFLTGTASACALSAAPQVLTALTFALMRVLDLAVLRSGSEAAADFYSRIWSLSGIGLWLLTAAVISFYCLCICIFAAMISGTAVMSLLNGMMLNGLATVLFTVRTYFYGVYMTGWCSDDAGYRFTHPAVYYRQEARSLLSGEGNRLLAFAGSVLAFTAVALLILAAAWLLCRKRAGERIGSSYLFDAAAFIIGLLGVLIGSIFFAALFGEATVSAYYIGALITLLIVQMVIRKTPRIFTKELLLPLVCSVLLLSLVLGYFVLDPLGIEKKVPKASEVASVQLTENHTGFKELTDPDLVEKALHLHQRIVSEPAALDGSWESGYDSASTIEYIEYKENFYTVWTSVRFDYTLTNGRTMIRSYTLPVAWLLQDDDLKVILESDRAREEQMIDRLKSYDLKNMTIYISSAEYATRVVSEQDMDPKILQESVFEFTEEEKQRIIETVSTCWLKRSYEQRLLSYYGNAFTVQITVFHPSDYDFEQYADEFTSSHYIYKDTFKADSNVVENFSFGVFESDEAAIDLLAELLRR